MEELFLKEIEKGKWKGLREERFNDVFKKRIYLKPADFKLTNYEGRQLLAVFNPGIITTKEEVFIFPRLIFDYYQYTSSIGVTRVKIKDIIDGNLKKPLETKIILYPKEVWEFLGCEDPRGSVGFEAMRLYDEVNEFELLYTGKGYYYKKENIYEEKLTRRNVLAVATFDKDFNVKERKYFKIVDGEKVLIPKSNKDSSFIEKRGNKCTMLTRPEMLGFGGCWSGVCDIEKFEIEADSLKLLIGPEEWEYKTGWSTNVVKLEDEKYIAGFHGILKKDLTYVDGFAILDGDGNLLGITDYLLYPRGVDEEYGDRALVIFGDGLFIYDEYIIWIGGMSDYAIGIFIAKLKDVLKKVKYL